MLLGRAKRKRKAKLKKKRLQKKKAGKNVPFTLSNCPKTLKGINSRYEYKVNVHNCHFTEANFSNVRYRSGHITRSTFKKANLTNVDFISINFKKSRFRETKFNNCIFFNCNLEGADFKNASFKNTYFISCKLKNLKNFIVSNELHILSQYPYKQICESLLKTIMLMCDNKTLERFHILTTENKSVNYWMLNLLLNKYSEEELIKFFCKLLIGNKEQFYTLYDYYFSLQNYYKR